MSRNLTMRDALEQKRLKTLRGTSLAGGADRRDSEWFVKGGDGVLARLANGLHQGPSG
jgi:hypothetical protein